MCTIFFTFYSEGFGKGLAPVSLGDDPLSSSSLPSLEGSSLDFGVSARFEAEEAELTVRGGADGRSAPPRGAFLDAAIVSGYPSVIVDLGDVEAMGDAMLAVITTAGHRLAASGAHLRVRSSLLVAGRIVAVLGDGSWLGLEPPATDRARLGPEQSPTAPAVPVNVPRASALSGLAQLSSIPAANDVVDIVLRLVVALARAAVGGA
ncbi:MAG: STAS domain-containing protein, partial [Acidimicrobiales bacterium]